MSSSSKQSLFGGAITASIPKSFIDASTFRQVPDSQEVFVDEKSDVSYIVEILQRVEPDEPAEAAKFHFDSIANDNDASAHEVLSIQTPSSQFADDSQTPSPIILGGLQKVTKFNRTISDDVYIILALYRVASKNVDIIFSTNIPLGEGKAGKLGSVQCEGMKRDFLDSATSLRILDFGLFA